MENSEGYNTQEHNAQRLIKLENAARDIMSPLIVLSSAVSKLLEKSFEEERIIRNSICQIEAIAKDMLDGGEKQ